MAPFRVISWIVPAQRLHSMNTNLRRCGAVRMKILKQRSGLRIISLSSISMLCVLLSSVMTPQGFSDGLLKKKT